MNFYSFFTRFRLQKQLLLVAGMFLLLLFLSCSDSVKSEPVASAIPALKADTLLTKSYTLITTSTCKTVLILFPCFGCNAEHTFNEFKITQSALANRIAVLAMNVNQKLYLAADEKTVLKNQVTEVLSKHGFNELIIGGFSSGGNVAIQLASELAAEGNKKLKALFIVDAPIDLERLYVLSAKNALSAKSEVAQQEGAYIKQLMDIKLGNPADSIGNYKLNSPYLVSQKSGKSFENLKDISIRFYCEPDTSWYWEERGLTIEEVNAFTLRVAANQLAKESFNISLIETKNKGYRANGERHPHSWRIVDSEDLIYWINSL